MGHCTDCESEGLLKLGLQLVAVQLAVLTIGEARIGDVTIDLTIQPGASNATAYEPGCHHRSPTVTVT